MLVDVAPRVCGRRPGGGGKGVRMTRVRQALLLAACGALLAGACAPAPTAAPTPAPQAKQLTRLNVQLGWIKNTEFAGLFVADQKGWFAEEGLEVNFIGGGAGVDPLTIVRANPDYIGVVSSSGTFINAVTKGAPFVAIGAYYQKHPNSFLVLEDSPIKTYKDFEGRRIGVQPEGEYYLDVLAAMHGLDKAKMQVVRVGFEPTPLVTGQIDAYMGWIVNQPFLIEKAGKTWRSLLLADNPGVQFYAMVPFVTKDMLAKKPDVIEKFTRASFRGWEYVLQQPDDAADLTVKHYLPGGDLAAEKSLLQHANPITVSEDTKRHGLGWMDPKRWEEGVQTLLKYKQIEQAPNVSEVMTNQFVEKVAIKR